MNPDIALRVILWRLLHTFQRAYLWQYLDEKPACVQQLKAAACVPFSEHLVQFVPNALAAHLMDFSRQRANRGYRAWFDLVVQARCKSYSAHHA